jgi:hypothetical protein
MLSTFQANGLPCCVCYRAGKWVAWALAAAACTAAAPQGAAARQLLLRSPQLTTALVAGLQNLPRQCRGLKEPIEMCGIDSVRGAGTCRLHSTLRLS